MTIARHTRTPFRLPLARPLTTAHGVVDVREGAIVGLVDADGTTGFGELAPLPGFGLEPLAEACDAVSRTAAALTGVDFADLDAALDRVEAETEKAPAARAALDVALHDLQSRRDGRSLADGLARAEGTTARTAVPVAALLDAREPDRLARQARRAIADGHRAVKLKLATGDDDRARVAAVRAVCPDDVELRLDANGAWSEAEAREWLAALAPARPAWLEQPIAPGDVGALARLRAASPFPIAVDEGLAHAGDAERLTTANAADVWVVKPAVVGGLRAARRLTARAHAAGALAVIGGFLDTAIGTAAWLALAAALPGTRPAGLGPSLEHDVARLPAAVDGARPVPAGPGLGVVPELAT